MNDSNDNNGSISRVEKIEFFVNTLNHTFIGITTFYLTWYCFRVGFNELITYHVWLTTIGYQLLMAEGILAMYKQNCLTLMAKTRPQKTLIHWLLQAAGAIFALVGIVIQIISRFRLGKAHFSMLHSILGLVSFISLTLTIISGCSALYSIELRKYLRPIFSKCIHNLLALVTFTTGMISIIIAYLTKTWARKRDPGDIRILMCWLLSFIIIFTLIGALKTLWSQRKSLSISIKAKMIMDDINGNKLL